MVSFQGMLVCPLQSSASFISLLELVAPARRKASVETPSAQWLRLLVGSLGSALACCLCPSLFAFIRAMYLTESFGNLYLHRPRPSRSEFRRDLFYLAVRQTGRGRQGTAGNTKRSMTSGVAGDSFGFDVELLYSDIYVQNMCWYICYYIYHHIY